MPGQGHRVAAQALREALAARPALHRLLLRYSHALVTQIACTALSNAVHSVAERLTRWLLMCHDRVDGNDIALTHGSLGTMLAVRRPTVTTTLGLLEGHGLIRIRRSIITVADRPGLEAFAGDAYGQPEAEHERLLGPMR